MAIEGRESSTTAADGEVAPRDGVSALDLQRVLDGDRSTKPVEPAKTEETEQDEAPADALYEPRLLLAEERTPLPEVDRAMPFLSLFPAVAGGRRGRYKVALLKTLQTDGSGRWRIRQLQEAVGWLDPTAVAFLARELRADGVLDYDSRRAIYRLTPEARVLSAVVDALTLPEIDPRRLIKYLSVAISLSRISGREEAAVASFASAVATLRADLDDLERLIDDKSEGSLLEAAEQVRKHVGDMQELLLEHESFRLQHSGDARFMRLEQQALALIAELGGLAADVVAWLTGKADELMRGGARIDRGDIREFVAEAEPSRLAALVDALVAAPPFVPWLSATAAFRLLAEKVGQERPTPPPLPQPERLTREQPLHEPDATELLEIELVALDAPATAADVVIERDWPTAVARHNALVDAYTRRRVPLPELEFSLEVEEPRRCGVARISKTTLRPERR
ncbi:MAG: hypothetical protein ACJ757_12955 [Gaiellaceae bacterium]